MKYLLLLDSCINSIDFNEIRIKQYENSLKSIFQFEDFLKRHFDIVFVDNSIESLEKFPTIKKIIPDYVKVITKVFNNYGRKTKTGGVFEHWILSKELWKNYDFLIHFETRQILKDKSFFENFISEPVSTFTWGNKERNGPIFGNFKNRDPNFKIKLYNRFNTRFGTFFNDFYTGMFSVKISEFYSFVNNFDLNSVLIIKKGEGKKSLEKIMMCFAYDELEEFKLVKEIGIGRYTSYSSIDSTEYY